MILIVEVKCVLVTLRERHVAQDGQIARHLAFDLRRNGPAAAPPVQDGAGPHGRLDIVAGDPHQQTDRFLQSSNRQETIVMPLLEPTAGMETGAKRVVFDIVLMHG